MNMKAIFAAAVIAASMLTTGCASIVSGSTQPITINSQPSGLPFIVKDSNGVAIAGGTTPSTISVPRKFSSATVEIHDRMDNSRILGQGTLVSGVNGWYFGNIIFGGLIGLVVDPMTGAAFKYSPESLMIGTR